MPHAEVPAPRVDSPMFQTSARTPSRLRTLRPVPRSIAPRLARPLRAIACTAAALLAMGCQPAQSTSTSNDTMFGLFKSKSPSTVDPAVGAALVREPAWPRGESKPPAPAWPALRDVSLTEAPPQGRISPTRIEQGPSDAWLAAGGGPGAPVLVNTYQPQRRLQLWEVDRHDPARLANQRLLKLDPQQDKWLFYNAGEAIALPGNQMLVDVGYNNPSPTDRLYVIDLATGAARNLATIEPDWAAGLPLHFLDSLQLTPDALLVVYRTDKVRLAAERYINRFDHLLLFSPRHPQGLEIARIGIDDGNVRDWRFAAGKLWLQTSDSRNDTHVPVNWSLDLSRVL